jgi:prophage regulatory protein
MCSENALIAPPGNLRDCFLRESEVLKFVGVSKITLRRWEQAGRFPKRYRLGPNTVGWKESEILNWIANREVAVCGSSKTGDA